MGTVHHDRGNFDLAMEMYRKRLELTRQMGDRQSEAYTRINMGLLEKQRGRYGQAEELYLESLKVMTELGDKRAMSMIAGKLADLFTATGKHGPARQHYQAAVEQAKRLGIDYYLCDMLLNFALLALEEGNSHESSELAALAMASAEKSGRKEIALSCRILQARLLSYEDRGRAIEELRRLEGECPEDEQRAEALYYLYRLKPEGQLKEKLLKVYGALLEKTPDQKYRLRINEIAGITAGQSGDSAT
jgi:tetratricopeptide (TPR) repeat protein